MKNKKILIYTGICVVLILLALAMPLLKHDLNSYLEFFDALNGNGHSRIMEADVYVMGYEIYQLFILALVFVISAMIIMLFTKSKKAAIIALILTAFPLLITIGFSYMLSNQRHGSSLQFAYYLLLSSLLAYFILSLINLGKISKSRKKELKSMNQTLLDN